MSTDLIKEIQDAAVADVFRRFFEKLELINECWVWLGSTNKDGYGLFHLSGKMRSAHRTSYELHIGSIPSGMEIDHLCNMRACVNPQHLEIVTREENLRRMMERKTNCVNGHDYLLYSKVNASGNRECTICAAEKKLAWQRRNRDKGIGLRADWTHCANGHEFTTENTIKVKKTNQRRCRICRNEKQAIRRANLK
jgi:hypothetical protein